MTAFERIKNHFNDSIQTKITAADTIIEHIIRAGDLIVQCLLTNNKILCCGNGNSAIDAQRFASAMLNRFESERPSLPAIALTANAATITSIANDYSFGDIFAKQIKALGYPHDILITLSTSGNSKNILEAVNVAHSRDLKVIALTGRDGGEMATLLTSEDIEIRVPTDKATRIHETHILIIHCLCDIIDHQLFATEE